MDSQILEEYNKEEWKRFKGVFELMTEPTLFFFQCDTDLVAAEFRKKINVLLNHKTTFILDAAQLKSDNLAFELSKIEITTEIVHILNLEAIIKKEPEFLIKLNTERKNIFRNQNFHVIIWANLFVTNTLQQQAFDFWSWIAFAFELNTPPEFLTSRQKEFRKEIILEDNFKINLNANNPLDRINELERQWQIVSKKPLTIKDKKNYFTISSLLVEELKDEGQFEKAKNVLDAALKICDDLLSEKNHLLNYLALIYQSLGDLNKAKELLELALASDIKNFGKDHPVVAIRQSSLAMVYKDLGEFNKAKEQLEIALFNDIKNFGKDHPTVAIRQSNLALVYQDLGDLKKAKELLELSLESDIKNYGKNHPNVARNQSNLAIVYKNLGDLNKAKDLFEIALESFIKNFGVENQRVAIGKSNLAMVYKDLGNFTKAKELLEHSLESDIKNYGKNHPNVTRNQSNLAMVYKDLGELNKAKELLVRALKTSEKILGVNVPLTKTIHKNLDDLLKKIDDQKKTNK